MVIIKVNALLKEEGMERLRANILKQKDTGKIVLPPCCEIVADVPDDTEVEVLSPPRWIPVEERLPETIPCSAGTEYSEAVIVWTSGKKAMIAVWNGKRFLCAADYWEAWDEKITHWAHLPRPLPASPWEAAHG